MLNVLIYVGTVRKGALDTIRTSSLDENLFDQEPPSYLSCMYYGKPSLELQFSLFLRDHCKVHLPRVLREVITANRKYLLYYLQNL
jgi:hypothetical protein